MDGKNIIGFFYLISRKKTIQIMLKFGRKKMHRVKKAQKNTEKIHMQ